MSGLDGPEMHKYSETACFNMYMPAFYRKYMWDMRAEQSILDGAVPNVVPWLKRGMVAEYGACPWADAGRDHSLGTFIVIMEVKHYWQKCIRE